MIDHPDQLFLISEEYDAAGTPAYRVIALGDQEPPRETFPTQEAAEAWIASWWQGQMTGPAHERRPADEPRPH